MATPEKIIKFYHSAKWRKARSYIRVLKHGICEECGAPGTEVHHIKALNLANVDDDLIAINPQNLQLLCAACHNAKRGVTQVRDDVSFDAEGNLFKRIKGTPQSKV